jgi:putative transposase
MAKPDRNASPNAILSPARIFFATTKTSMGRRLLQSERNAGLLIDVMRSSVAEHQFKLHDFVVMPDHLHVLLTVGDGMTLEKAMQLIKGRFSRRLTQASGNSGEVWQRGFTEVQVLSRESFLQHRTYIAMNPVKAGLVDSPGQYPFCFEFLAKQKSTRKNQAGAKAPEFLSDKEGTTEVVPCYKATSPELNTGERIEGAAEVLADATMKAVSNA